MEPNPVASIAHKLRTPLTVITSTVNNLLDGAFGALNPDQTKWLKKLESHTASLESLQTQILELLRKNQSTTNEIDEKITPLSENPAKKETPFIQKISPSHHKTPSILIVDDEPDILDLIQEGMSSKGFQTNTAATGDEALQRAGELNPDLILMDVLLKDHNGIEVCRQIKSELRSFVPVILVTGQDDLRDKITGHHHDADDVLSKPFQMEELFARVTSMLRIKQLHDQVEQAKSQGFLKVGG